MDQGRLSGGELEWFLVALPQLPQTVYSLSIPFQYFLFGIREFSVSDFFDQFIKVLEIIWIETKVLFGSIFPTILKMKLYKTFNIIK